MPIFVNAQEDSGRWDEYYRLRNWARLALASLSVGLYLLAYVPVPATEKLNKLSPAGVMTVVVLLIGVTAIIVAAPVLRWMEWRCPRCRSKFAQSRYFSGSIFLLVSLLWRLVYPSRCGHCGLRCGAPTDYEI
jgi:uncharacterized membrane protein